MQEHHWESALILFKSHLQYEKNLAENTLLAYLQDVQKLKNYLPAVQTPIAINRVQIEEFIGSLGELSLSAYTQNRVLSGIRAFYDCLLRNQWLEENPAQGIPTPKIGRKLPEVLHVHEIQKILASFDLSKPEGVRNRAMVEVLYGSGLRVSELTGLKIANLLFDVGFIRVVGKGNKERYVPIGKEAIKHVTLYRAHTRSQVEVQKGEEAFVFLNKRGRRLSRVMMFNIVRDAAALAGIDKKVSPHTFRHSFATHLVEGGADLRAVQEMLGHESITTTEIYTHLDMGYLRTVVEEFHPLFAK